MEQGILSRTRQKSRRPMGTAKHENEERANGPINRVGIQSSVALPQVRIRCSYRAPVRRPVRRIEDRPFEERRVLTAGGRDGRRPGVRLISAARLARS